MLYYLRILSFIFLLSYPGFGYSQNSEINKNKNGDPGLSILKGQDTGILPSIHRRPHLIAVLPTVMNETSGLLMQKCQLWTINDGGNPAAIYRIDTTTGNILHTIVIRNAINTDWESLTQDDSDVYIGDFGNNSGNRSDLRILKIPKAELFSPEADTVNSTYIYFSYPDQTSFVADFCKTVFDCEAFFIQNDSIHLFTKDWSDQQTKHYILPSDTGTYVAKLVESFDAGGLITDAAINEKGNMTLLGYKNTWGKFYTCFIWEFSSYKGCFYFSGNKRRVRLGSALYAGQTEGMVLNNDNTVWLSSERIKAGWLSLPAKLFTLDLRLE